jgi:hypothetical protein
MAMPTGDSPHTAEQYYLYLQGHQVPRERVASWNVDWISLAWLWGFVIVLAIIAIVWIRQYRTTWQRTGINPIDRWGGYTTEAAGPVTVAFLVISAVVVCYVAVIIVGHLIWGQKF